MSSVNRGRKRRATSIYDVLDQVRARPGMFIGDVSIMALEAFTSGLGWSELPAGHPSFWEFNRWASAVFDDSTLPWRLLEQRVGRFAAVQHYFQYLDEYRACREVVLARARGAFVSKAFRIFPSGAQRRLPAPDTIVVGQFHPSRVFYVATKRHGAIEKYPLYFRTKSGAMRSAEQAWSFPKTLWRPAR
jgi:hypothetical protein